MSRNDFGSMYRTNIETVRNAAKIITLGAFLEPAPFGKQSIEELLKRFHFAYLDREFAFIEEDIPELFEEMKQTAFEYIREAGSKRDILELEIWLAAHENEE